MNKLSTPLEIFHPILIQNFIRFETAAHYIRNQEAAISGSSNTCHFKISSHNYNLIIEYANTAPLLDLALTYDEDNSILSVEPNDTFIETYKNAIMRDVALKQSEDSKGRYDKFIQVID